MCGIVGYVGSQPASPFLLDGLRRLEYRGYDSAGIAFVSQAGLIEVTRASGRLESLTQKLNGHSSAARIGIGHTRWATHGRPSEHNAHPHSSHDGKVVAVHNGIFENYLELRQELGVAGIKLKSETDSECFPVLVAYLMHHGMWFEEAFRVAVTRMQGIFAIACLHADHPERVLVARSGPPLVIGLGSGENFLASDVTPLLAYTRDILFLEDGDIAEITPSAVRVFDSDGRPRERAAQRIDWDPAAAELGNFRHFMQKEIFEQPEALARTLAGRLPEIDSAPLPLDLPFSEDEIRGFDRVLILGLRDVAARGARGQVSARAARGHFGRGRLRLRVPISLSAGQPAHPGRGDHTERRDGGHAGGSQASRAPWRPHDRDLQRPGLADHAPGRKHAVHTRRPRNRRRLHQGLHDPTCALVLFAMKLGESGNGSDEASRTGCSRLRELPARLDGVRRLEPKSSSWPSAGTPHKTRSISGAGRSTRLHSRARSS